jgi:hypothetical protein
MQHQERLQEFAPFINSGTALFQLHTAYPTGRDPLDPTESGLGRVGNVQVTSTGYVPYQRLDSEAGISYPRQ